MISKLHSKRNENIHPDRNKYSNVYITSSFITAKDRNNAHQWMNGLISCGISI